MTDTTIGDVTALLERRYPPHTAEDWDRVGLVLGAPSDPARRLLLTVDVTAEVVEQARDLEVELIIAHHPLLLRGVTSLRRDSAKGALVTGLLRAGIGLFTAHTNADIATDGTAAALASALGLRDARPLRPVPVITRHKLVCSVPVVEADRLIDALAAAGAGAVGHYDRAAFVSDGTGTFRPLPGAEPHLGTVGRIERVPETRIEMIMDSGRRRAVEQALLATHPYETPAYDFTAVAPIALDADTGLGRVGEVDPTTVGDFARRVAEVLPRSGGAVRVTGDPQRPVRRVAVQAGAGDDLLDEAAAEGVDLYLTSDLRHHPAAEAIETVDSTHAGEPPALIDVPHWAAEWLWLPVLRETIMAELSVQVMISELSTDPWQFSITSD